MSNFGFNFHLSNLFFGRCVAKSHNLEKRSRLTTIMSDGKDLDLHLRSRSPFYGIYLIFSAHISAFHLTSAQATINIRFGRHFACAHLGIFPDICAGDHQYMLWVAFCLRTTPGMGERTCGVRTLSLCILLYASVLWITAVRTPLLERVSTNKPCL